MSIKRQYSEALTNNIERTFTYAHAKNAHGLDVEPHNYNAIDTFNKLVARELNISEKTVHIHRQHVMEKAEVGSAAELARLMLASDSAALD